MNVRLPLLALASLVALCAHSETKTSPPFSESILTGNTLYVAGHIGFDAATKKVPADTEAEVRAAMDAVKHSVEEAGLTMDDVVSVTVYCTDLDLYDKFNGIYRGYFHKQFPTRAFIGIAKLLAGAHFEISAIAVKEGLLHKT